MAFLLLILYIALSILDYFPGMVFHLPTRFSLARSSFISVGDRSYPSTDNTHKVDLRFTQLTLVDIHICHTYCVK